MVINHWGTRRISSANDTMHFECTDAFQEVLVRDYFNNQGDVENFFLFFWKLCGIGKVIKKFCVISRQKKKKKNSPPLFSFLSFLQGIRQQESVRFSHPFSFSNVSSLSAFVTSIFRPWLRAQENNKKLGPCSKIEIHMSTFCTSVEEGESSWKEKQVQWWWWWWYWRWRTIRLWLQRRLLAGK